MTHVRRRSIRALLPVCAALLAAALSAPTAANAATGLSTQDLTGSLTAADLASALVGTGVTVSNAQFTGAPVAGGTFTGGGSGAGAIIGFDQGVILSSGAVASVVGPNSSDGISTENGLPGDTSLDAILPQDQQSFDAASLSFDFVPNAAQVSFSYVFASDEYNEYVGSFNDVFGFFVNGTNCATVGGQPVSVDTINGGNPFGTTDPQNGVVASNPDLFRNNDPNDPGPATIDTEMDGLTTVLTCTASVTPNQTNTMKLAIADVGDESLDSNVFIQAGSLTTSVVPGAPTDVSASPGDGSASVSWSPPASDGGSAIDGYDATCTATNNGDDVHTASVDGSTLSAQVTGLTNGVEYTCAARAHNANGFGPYSGSSSPVVPSSAQFSAVIDTSQGGTLPLIPAPGQFLGTAGRITIPPQAGPPTQIVVTASFFGTPGEVDASCGGHRCVGQGIEWAVSDPSAVKHMRVAFFESHKLVGDASPLTADVYKDGKLLPDCGTAPRRTVCRIGCVVFRGSTPKGGWWIVIRVNGSDPRGRI